jgi:hypothetical protein
MSISWHDNHRNWLPKCEKRARPREPLSSDQTICKETDVKEGLHGVERFRMAGTFMQCCLFIAKAASKQIQRHRADPDDAVPNQPVYAFSVLVDLLGGVRLFPGRICFDDGLQQYFRLFLVMISQQS